MPREEWLTYRHKYVFLKVLKDALDDPNYDFSSEFAFDYESNEYNCIAWDETEIEDPRGFFQDIYNHVYLEWKTEVDKAAREDMSKW